MGVGGREVTAGTLTTAAPAAGGFFLSGDIVQPLVTGKQTGGECTLARITVLPGSGQSLHRHAQHETLYVLDGELELTGVRGGKFRTFGASAGILMHVPGCVPHRYFNPTTKPATLLSFSTSAGLDGFYARAGQKVACVTDAAGMQPDAEKIEGVGWEFGIEPIDAELYDSREGYRASGAHFAGPSSGQSLIVLDSLVRLLTDATQAEGWVTTAEITQRPGGGMPPMRHGGAGTYLVLDGSFTFEVQSPDGAQRVEASAGTAVYRPAGMVSSYRNSCSGNSRMLALYTPSGIEDFVRTVGRELASAEEFFAAPSYSMPAGELERVAALGTQLGVEIQL
jgi:quercetin dioxygenase-like cupin family protein